MIEQLRTAASDVLIYRNQVEAPLFHDIAKRGTSFKNTARSAEERLCEHFLEKYGKRERFELHRYIVDILAELCARNDASTKIPHRDDPRAKFFSRAPQDIALDVYIQRFVAFLDVTPAAFVAGLLYLQRLEQLDSTLHINSYNVHRLFLTAVHLGIKYTEDVGYAAHFIAKVGGLSSSREVNALERQMLMLLKFELYIDPQVFLFLKA